MSIIKDFLKKLVGTTEKEDIINSLGTDIKALRDYIEICKENSVWMSSIPEPAPEVKPLLDKFYSRLKLRRGKDIFGDSVLLLENAIANAERMVNFVTEEFMDSSVSENLSAKKVLALKFTDSLSYVTNFYPDLIDVIVSHQLKQFGAGSETLVTKATFKRVDSELRVLSEKLAFIGTTPREFESSFKKLADVAITESNESLVSNNLSKAFQGMQIMGFNYSPILFIRRRIEDLRMWNHDRIKNNVQYLKLRTLQIENQLAQSPDPALEKELEIIKNRIDKLSYKISEFEDSVNR